MPRRGITLTEVLVAVFVAGLGLMALMTLFPLGALNMSLAIKDDRATQAGANATAFLRAMWRQGLDSGQPDPNIVTALAHGPAYLDPVGQMTYAGGGGPVGGIIPRIGLAALAKHPAAIMNDFSLMDDLEFDFNGQAKVNGSLERNYLYTWAYMLRPPRVGDSRVVDFSVVVYNRRSASLSGSVPAGEIPAAATFNASNKTITVAGQPPVHKGSWVLDASAGVPPVAHAYFYQVNSVTHGGGSTMLVVDQPLRGWDDVGGQGPGQIVIMQNVIAVFEKSTLE